VDAYTLVLASLLMLSGSTADRLGRRRTFVIGLLTFAAGSLLCSLAPNLTRSSSSAWSRPWAGRC
jgi:MFS family permease